MLRQTRTISYQLRSRCTHTVMQTDVATHWVHRHDIYQSALCGVAEPAHVAEEFKNATALGRIDAGDLANGRLGEPRPDAARQAHRGAVAPCTADFVRNARKCKRIAAQHAAIHATKARI